MKGLISFRGFNKGHIAILKQLLSKHTTRSLSTSLIRAADSENEPYLKKLFAEPKLGTVFPDGTRNHPPSNIHLSPFGISGSKTIPTDPAPDWQYRQQSKGPEHESTFYTFYGPMVVNAMLWYWVLFHLYYQYDHVLGHFATPDPSDWTDQELGIPPDSADDPEMVPVPPVYVRPLKRSFFFYFYADEEEDSRPDGPVLPHVCIYYPVRCILLNRCPDKPMTVVERGHFADELEKEENLLTGKTQKPTRYNF